ncbi:MAG: type IV secretion protein Rhs, partial [Flavobacterium sp.]
MALQTTTTIKIGDTIVKNFTHLEINQEIHDHHTFSIELRQDLLVGEFESNLPVSQNLSAEKVSIEIKPMSDLDLTDVENHNDYILHFYGVVTNVSMRKSRVHD